jgi:hypothetical protein
MLPDALAVVVQLRTQGAAVLLPRIKLWAKG